MWVLAWPKIFQRIETTPTLEKLFKYFKSSDFQTQFVELLTDEMELVTQIQNFQPGKCCHKYNIVHKKRIGTFWLYILTSIFKGKRCSSYSNCNELSKDLWNFFYYDCGWHYSCYSLFIYKTIQNWCSFWWRCIKGIKGLTRIVLGVDWALVSNKALFFILGIVFMCYC